MLFHYNLLNNNNHTGRRFDFINTKDFGVGTFSVNLDGSKYPSGTYYCRMISDSGIRTIKLVKE